MHTPSPSPRAGALRRLLDRFAPAAQPVALPPVPQSGGEALALALGIPAAQAQLLAARAAGHQRGVLRDVRRAGPAAALRRLRRQVRAHALAAPPAGAAVLALPLTRAAVAFVAERARGGRTLRVLRTPASEAFLSPFLAAEGPARLCTATEMLAHARAAGAGDDTLYVTFPEHYQAGSNASRPVRFLGGDHLFSLLEALLLGRGVRLLGADVRDGAACLAECPVSVQRGALSAEQLDAVVRWLAECAERVVAAAPAELLTWGWVERQSHQGVARSRVLSLNNLQGFLRVWRAAGTGLPDPVYGWSVAELERLRGQVQAGTANHATAGGAA
jgi:hypothetical protein